MMYRQVNVKYLAKNKGSLTVETALVTSVLIFILFTLVFSFMLMYQKAVLEKTASMVAQQGAEIWVDSHKQIDNGYWELDQKKDSFYYRLFDDSLFTGKKYSVTLGNLSQLESLISGEKGMDDIEEEKFSKMKVLLISELQKGLLKPSKTKINISFDNVLQRKIEVDLTQNVKMPLSFIGKIIGKSGSLDLTGKGVAVVTEPAENIRNIDLGMEYAKKIREGIDINAFTKKLKGEK